MGPIDSLPPLRDYIREFGLTARKSLGQNFLCDLNLTSRISRAAGTLENSCILEIGPGPGGLTRALLAMGASKVVVVERDVRCLEILERISEYYPNRLTIQTGDALNFEWDQYPVDSVKIVSNLPYNIATPLLIKWLSLEVWPPWWESMTLMFQKEVAERIVAEPNGKSYGRLSVISGWRTMSRKLFDVSPAAFTPPPKVTSSVVHIQPLTEHKPCRVKDLEKVTAAAFGQRRKMLRSSLKSLSVNTDRLLEESGLDEKSRAESVSIDGFVALANAYGRQSQLA